MNAIRQAQNAYGSGAQPIKTTRDNEYDSFARITHRIKNAAARGQAGFPDLVAALHDNRRLWTILVTDVADKENPLPADLKARIVYLAEFTEFHSRKVLRDGAEPGPLIEINAAIMSGLHPRRHAS